MPKPAALMQLERNLAELGCPDQLSESRLREIADHWEDLKLAGIAEGLSEAAAEARANELLGEPVAIAEQLAVVLRQSSWWGRHRIIAFCFLPPIGIFAASIVALFATLGALRLFFSPSEWSVLADQGAGFGLLVKGVELANYAATAGITLLFCWLARRSVAGLRWALLACGVCSLQSCFGYCRIAPHTVSIGYSLSPDWICVLIPLLIAAAIWARQGPNGVFRPKEQGFNPGVFHQAGPNSVPWSGNAARRVFIAYPTYWILGALTVALLFLLLSIWVQVRREMLPAQPPAKTVPGARLVVEQRWAPSDQEASERNFGASGAGSPVTNQPWQRVLMIGASATAGFTESELFGGPHTALYRLSRYVDAALITPHEPVRNLGSTFFFMQPEAEAQREMDLAIEAKPTLVIGVDFLFWFCYGDGRTDQERLRRFEHGLQLCERVTCPLVLGDIPDASRAVNRMLSPDEMPSPIAIAAANRRLKQWATTHRNVVIVALSEFMHTVEANAALSLHGQKIPAGKTAVFLQPDRLHPSPPGCAVLALIILDNLQMTRPLSTANEIRWDPTDVFKRGYTGANSGDQRR